MPQLKFRIRLIGDSHNIHDRHFFLQQADDQVQLGVIKEEQGKVVMSHPKSEFGKLIRRGEGDGCHVCQQGTWFEFRPATDTDTELLARLLPGGAPAKAHAAPVAQDQVEPQPPVDEFTAPTPTEPVQSEPDESEGSSVGFETSEIKVTGGAYDAPRTRRFEDECEDHTPGGIDFEDPYFDVGIKTILKRMRRYSSFCTYIAGMLVLVACLDLANGFIRVQGISETSYKAARSGWSSG